MYTICWQLSRTNSASTPQRKTRTEVNTGIVNVQSNQTCPTAGFFCTHNTFIEAPKHPSCSLHIQ